MLHRLKNWFRSAASASAVDKSSAAVDSDYARRLAQESSRFEKEIDVNALPPIFHYWSNKYLRPILESFGFSNPDQFYARHIADRAAAGRPLRVLSIGAGNCDTELRIAQCLRDWGVDGWHVTCLDLVPAMLERGREMVAKAGFGAQFDFQQADFNHWNGDGCRFDVVMANQCLHHVVELERLFDRIPAWLAGDGTFISSDMIGRNGHQRWPEARRIVDRFWSELPENYRYNQQLRRQEDRFLDWDCSVEGFEGIRSQDILPLLLERFGFERFIGFGNVIDPFIDRGFGWNFDAEAAWDRDFVDRVHAADEAALLSGEVKPTHMMAVMRMDRGLETECWHGLTPKMALRAVD
ncbi:MAG: class I SAM-dependent methyltransferase [Lysobacteraceae bacterium]